MLVFLKFGVLYFLGTPVLRFAFLPYYRREGLSAQEVHSFTVRVTVTMDHFITSFFVKITLLIICHYLISNGIISITTLPYYRDDHTTVRQAK